VLQFFGVHLSTLVRAPKLRALEIFRAAEFSISD